LITPKQLEEARIILNKLNDGMDYIRHNLWSRKDAPLADYEPIDGSIAVNLDEIWNQVKGDTYLLTEDSVIALYLECVSHELHHKWFNWGMDNPDSTFNETDERTMRMIGDWVNFGKMTKGEMYDWK